VLNADSKEDTTKAKLETGQCALRDTVTNVAGVTNIVTFNFLLADGETSLLKLGLQDLGVDARGASPIEDFLAVILSCQRIRISHPVCGIALSSCLMYLKCNVQDSQSPSSRCPSLNISYRHVSSFGHY